MKLSRSTGAVTDPKPIAGNWDCVKQPVDAAYVGSGSRAGKMYLFFGAKWVRYDIAKNTCDTAPKAIAGSWQGLPWTADIDAVVAYNGKAYFFKGDSYVRFNIDRDVAEGGATLITRGWPGVWADDIEQAVNWGGGDVYLFRRGEVVRYLTAKDKERAAGPATSVADDPRFSAVDEAFRRGAPALPAATFTAHLCSDVDAKAIDLAWNQALGNMENVVLPAFRGTDAAKATVVEAAYRAHFQANTSSTSTGAVVSRFEDILKGLSGHHHVVCATPEMKCKANELAWVPIVDTTWTEQQNMLIRALHPVFFCPAFFTAKHESKRWVTVVHERAHHAGALNDIYAWMRSYPPAWPGSRDNADSYAHAAQHVELGRRP